MSRRSLLVGGFVLLPTVLLIVAGCNRKQPPPPEAPEVVVVHPVEADYVEYAYYTGRTVPVFTSMQVRTLSLKP